MHKAACRLQLDPPPPTSNTSAGGAGRKRAARAEIYPGQPPPPPLCLLHLLAAAAFAVPLLPDRAALGPRACVRVALGLRPRLAGARPRAAAHAAAQPQRGAAAAAGLLGAAAACRLPPAAAPAALRRQPHHAAGAGVELGLLLLLGRLRLRPRRLGRRRRRCRRRGLGLLSARLLRGARALGRCARCRRVPLAEPRLHAFPEECKRTRDRTDQPREEAAVRHCSLPGPPGEITHWGRLGSSPQGAKAV
ncbi:MAG: hypothetical protein J3K34DRAFT_86443 [Monoraphidium minutum]|nr:MAG: hypothetical protein J3K34DRAFT_86443 [Monoraphidium minutum]